MEDDKKAYCFMCIIQRIWLLITVLHRNERFIYTSVLVLYTD